MYTVRRVNDMDDFKHISTRRIFSILILVVVILTVFRSGWILYHKDPEGPQAEAGVIDLRDETFNKKQTFALDGEWEFYPNIFLIHDNSNHQDKTYLAVPEDWGTALTTDDAIHYGTYRLKVLMPNDEQGLGL